MMMVGGHGAAPRRASGPGDLSVEDKTERVIAVCQSLEGTTNSGCVQRGLGGQRVWVLFSGTERVFCVDV